MIVKINYQVIITYYTEKDNYLGFNQLSFHFELFLPLYLKFGKNFPQNSDLILSSELSETINSEFVASQKPIPDDMLL